MSTAAAEKRQKKIQLEQELAETGVECFNSFYTFFLTFWPEMSGETYHDNWHIEYICNTLQEKAMILMAEEEIMETIIINVPPGSSKSTIATIAFPLWVWLRKPSFATTNISYSSDLSKDHARKARGITDSDKWHALFDNLFLKIHGKKLLITKQNENRMENNFNGARFNTSVGGTITGMHANIIIEDDPLNPKEAFSDSERQTALSFHDDTVTSRKKNFKSYINIIIAQRLHEEDTCGHVLKQNRSITHIQFPAELTSTTKVIPGECIKYYVDGVLDPHRKPKEVLDDMKAGMTPVGYAGQFLQMPFNLEDQDIKPSMFEEWEEEQIPAGTYFDVWVDGAFTEKNENDPSGIDLIQRVGNNVVVKRSHDVRKKLPDLLKFIIELEEKGEFDRDRSRIFIEPKASGLPLADLIEAETQYNFVRIGEHNKQEAKLVNAGKKARHEVIKPKAESHRIKVIKGSWNNDFIMQICGFPRAAHDEHVDNLGYAINHYYMNENCFVDNWAINMLERNVTGSFPVMAVTQKRKHKLIVDVKENDKGKIELFEYPENHHWNRYIVVLVLRSEAERNGKNCITVFDRLNKTVCATIVQSKMTATEAGYATMELAYYFHKALIVVGVKKEVGTAQNEEMDLSHMAIKEIRDHEYDNIYTRLKENDIRKSREREYGFIVDQSTKREIYYYLKASIEKRKLTAMPLPMFNDVKVVERKKGAGEIDAREGFEVNALLSLGIAHKVDDEMIDEVKKKTVRHY